MPYHPHALGLQVKEVAALICRMLELEAVSGGGAGGVYRLGAALRHRLYMFNVIRIRDVEVTEVRVVQSPNALQANILKYPRYRLLLSVCVSPYHRGCRSRAPPST